MKRFRTLLAPTLILLFCGGPSARAELIPFTYNFTPVQDASHPYDPNHPETRLAGLNSEDGTGTIALTNEPSLDVKGKKNATDAVATNIVINSLADPEVASDHIGIQNPADGNYTLELVLTDKKSTKSAIIFFNGQLSGDFSKSNSNLDNTFLGATSKDGKVTGSGTDVKWTGELGGNTYTVDRPSFANPAPPSAQNKGGISFRISASSDTVEGGGGQTTPEPSSMLLSCLGLSFLGAASWRKRRARVA